ncbi:hypothetical protein [Clostridium botulinum]|uniref:hypothetical protein n=1 Tax=Clostridium botulinum TaxID=1491 RepID=UPI0019672311|nr:hypothetical protein [Clostridium botulinum]
MKDANLRTLKKLQDLTYVKHDNNTHSVYMYGKLLADFYGIEPLNIFLNALGMESIVE